MTYDYYNDIFVDSVMRPSRETDTDPIPWRDTGFVSPKRNVEPSDQILIGEPTPLLNDVRSSDLSLESNCRVQCSLATFCVTPPPPGSSRISATHEALHRILFVLVQMGIR